ncbi:MAG: lmo0937 family membrane protein [Acidobacteria bacterium]|nr:MAG: lmo0937 family membrane protein [Acidobacteriota bacterium]
MLETIVVLLILMWLLGWIAVPNVGPLIHILLVVAIVVVIIRLLQGRRVV